MKRLSLTLALALAVFVVAIAPGGGAAAAPPRCYFKVVGPEQRNSGLVSRAVFRCRAAYRAARVRVVLQRRVKGRWTRLAGVRRRLDIAVGRTYTVRTKNFPCHSTLQLTRTLIRTFFVMATRTRKFAFPSAGSHVPCTF